MIEKFTTFSVKHANVMIPLPISTQRGYYRLYICRNTRTHTNVPGGGVGKGGDIKKIT